MACETVNLTAIQGDNWTWTATFVDDSDAPIDLTAYDDVQMQIRKKTGTAVIAQAFLNAGDFSVIGEDSNILSLDLCELPGDVTGVYQFDVELVSNGLIETVIRGTVNILPEITIFTP